MSPLWEEAGDEGAGACEGVDYVNSFAAEGLVELGLQQVIDGVDDEVHHLDGSVNDAEPLGHAREGIAEEFIVELDDDFLFPLRVIDASGTHFHAGVEFLQGVGFLFESVLMEDIQHALHGGGDGIIGSERIILKEGIEYGFGDEVLGEHLNDFLVGDGVVKVIAEFIGKTGEGGDFLGIVWITDNLGDALDVGLGDLGDILGPFIPVVAVTTFFDDLGEQGTFELADVELKIRLGEPPPGVCLADTVLAFSCGFVGFFPFGCFGGFLLDGIGDGNDLHFLVVLTDEIEPC